MSNNTASLSQEQDIFGGLNLAKAADTREYRHRTTRRRKTIEQRFLEFHEANPEVYDLFVQFARQAKDAGFKRYGCRAIMERIRWHVEIELKKTDPLADFKLNNDFCPRYARKVMEENADLETFFEIRVLKAA